MPTKHVKSPCCWVRSRRYGARRRQCSQCKKTWTLRPRRRGRPKWRTPPQLAKRILLEGVTVRHAARHYSHIQEHAFRYRFRNALRQVVARDTIHIPDGPLVLLADGIWFHFHKKPWVLYLMAVKPCHGTQAFFLKPVLLPGSECGRRWEQAIDSIPMDIQSRIGAAVVDNLRGMRDLVKRRGWILQLCHFHLLCKLRTGHGYRLRAPVAGDQRVQLYKLVHHALQASEKSEVDSLLIQLRELATHYHGTRRVRGMIYDFLRFFHHYQAYALHPQYQLPITTNSLESTGALIRMLLRRSRAASNPRALHLWVSAFLKIKATITCNGH